MRVRSDHVGARLPSRTEGRRLANNLSHFDRRRLKCMRSNIK